jgi:hypothetical protein
MWSQLWGSAGKIYLHQSDHLSKTMMMSHAIHLNTAGFDEYRTLLKALLL